MGNKHRVLLILLALVLIGLSCIAVDRFMCIANGGEWIAPFNKDEISYCESKEKEEDSGNVSAVEENNTSGNDSTSNHDPQPVESQYAPEYTDPAECAAPESLSVDIGDPEVKDTNSETRCNYTITFTNTGNELIWVYLHKRYKLFDAEAEDFWKDHLALDPGEHLDMRYSTLLYKSEGDKKIDIIIGVAPITATQGCRNTFQDNVSQRAVIGYPISVPCE